MEELEAFPSKIDQSIIDKIIPQDVIKIGETVGQISVVKLAYHNNYEEVVVSDVLSPSYFWVQLRKNLIQFKSFMKEMHDFYEEQKSLYRVPLIALKPGLNIACLYGEEWHRGIIKSVLPDGHSFVSFYDFGNVENYIPSELFFLHRRFADLPAQAILCSLHNIQPSKSSKWHKSVIMKFIKKTTVPLVATVVTKNVEENSMSVCLTDTQGEEDLHINDWMYFENLAIKGHMLISQSKNFGFKYYVKCLEQMGYDPTVIYNRKMNTEAPLMNLEPNFKDSDRNKNLFFNKNSSKKSPSFEISDKTYEPTHSRNQSGLNSLLPEEEAFSMNCKSNLTDSDPNENLILNTNSSKKHPSFKISKEANEPTHRRNQIGLNYLFPEAEAPLMNCETNLMDSDRNENRIFNKNVPEKYPSLNILEFKETCEPSHRRNQTGLDSLLPEVWPLPETNYSSKRDTKLFNWDKGSENQKSRQQDEPFNSNPSTTCNILNPDRFEKYRSIESIEEERYIPPMLQRTLMLLEHQKNQEAVANATNFFLSTKNTHFDKK